MKVIILILMVINLGFSILNYWENHKHGRK